MWAIHWDVSFRPQVGIEDVVSIAAGRQQSIALKSDGTVWAWGDRKHVGNGTEEGPWPWPVQVMQDDNQGLGDVVSIATGSGHSLGLKSNGSVWGWGWDSCGSLGPGGNKILYSAELLAKVGSDGVDLAIGGESSFLRQSDGTWLRWGLNYAGALQDGSSERVECLWGTSNPTPEILPVFGTAREIFSDSDVDGDGIPDGWELEYGLDLLNNDADQDFDGDGLTNLQEFQGGASPRDPDSNNDGLMDGASIWAGIDPFSDDSDGDGLSNQEERMPPGTLIFNGDSDGDGVSDGPLDPDGDGPIVAGPDAFPWDSSRFLPIACEDARTPPCDPQDVTPPTITVRTPRPSCVDPEATGQCQLE